MSDRLRSSPEAKGDRKGAFLDWGRCPQTPGIYRLAARMARFLGAARAAPPFRPLVGALVASLRCRILRPGEVSIDRVGQVQEVILERAWTDSKNASLSSGSVLSR